MLKRGEPLDQGPDSITYKLQRTGRKKDWSLNAHRDYGSLKQRLWLLQTAGSFQKQNEHTATQNIGPIQFTKGVISYLGMADNVENIKAYHIQYSLTNPVCSGLSICWKCEQYGFLKLEQRLVLEWGQGGCSSQSQSSSHMWSSGMQWWMAAAAAVYKLPSLLLQDWPPLLPE